MIKEFKQGVLGMPPRPFGEKFVEEVLVRKYNLTRVNQQHDFVNTDGHRIEAKFTRVMEKPQGDGMDLIMNYATRSFASIESKWTACFQKIHPGEFDILFYGIIFDEGMAFYSGTVEEMLPVLNNQHLNNTEMKQFHINNNTNTRHKDRFVEVITWDEMYKIMQ